MWIDIALVVGAYLLGSISAAIVTARLMGLPDPRSEGSGNPGATNVLRLGGRKAALITLAGDILKGLVPVLIAHALDRGPLVLSLVAGAAFLGHLYPVFFGFKGGKGVATALGVLLGLYVWLGLAALATWLLVAYFSRISSLSALAAAALAPVYSVMLPGYTAITAAVSAMSVLLIWRHRSNIRKIIAGTEERFTL